MKILYESNLKDRYFNRQSDFEIKFIPSIAQEMSFLDARIYTAKKIYETNKNIFVGISGGMDSEAVAKSFVLANVPFTPIIARYPDNSEEVEMAVEVCKEFDIQPKFLVFDDVKVCEIMYLIYKKFNGIGTYIVADMACSEYSLHNEGVFVVGRGVGHGDGDDIVDVMSKGEYVDYSLITHGNQIPFFIVTPEITRATLIKPLENETWSNYKSRLYGSKPKLKVRAKLSITTQKFSDTLNRMEKRGNVRAHIGTIDEVRQFFKTENEL